MNKRKQLSLADHPGLFVVMGYGREPELEIARPLAHVEGCRSLTRSFDRVGTLFLYTTLQDVAENNDCLVINLGHARDKATGEVLSAQDLLDRQLATVDMIAYDKLAGNTSIACVSKHEPKACLFRSLVGTSALMYYQSGETFVCSDTLRLLIPFLPKTELAPEALVMHFLFRASHGSTTYLRDVYRIKHGHLAKWSGTELGSQLVQDLRPFSQPTIERVDDVTVADFCGRAERIVGSYVAWLHQHGYAYANKLSGGTDSSVLQYLINQSLPDGGQPKSSSYAMLTPDFEPEIEYALSASKALHTQHELVRLDPKDYPDLLQHTTELIGQPVGHESWPCQMAFSKHIFDHGLQTPFLFSGEAADTLHGFETARRHLQLDAAQKIPLAEAILRAMAVILDPVLPNKAYGSRELAFLLRAMRNIYSPDHPLNSPGLYTDVGLVQRCFSSETIKDTFVTMRELGTTYSDASSTTEQVQVLHLAVLRADEQPVITELHKAFHQQGIYPYLDYEFIEATFAFDPRVRFYANGRVKPIMKRILDRCSEYPSVDRLKRSGGFDNDLQAWMKDGVLRDMVRSIERPAFMERADFERKLEQPDWFTWNMLTLDLFQKYVL